MEAAPTTLTHYSLKPRSLRPTNLTHYSLKPRSLRQRLAKILFIPRTLNILSNCLNWIIHVMQTIIWGVVNRKWVIQRTHFIFENEKCTEVQWPHSWLRAWTVVYTNILLPLHLEGIVIFGVPRHQNTAVSTMDTVALAFRFGPRKFQEYQ